MQNITRFKPSCPEEFIGPARKVAVQLQRAIAHSRANDFSPIKQYLSGPSGTGKTALVDFAIAELGASRWAIKEFNGTDITIDRIRTLEAELHLTVNELFGDWRVLAIHEADRMTEPAQVKMLTILDNLPDRTALFCTTNKPMSEMEERFQRRFKFTEVNGAEDTEIKDWLHETWGLPEATATQIAFYCAGNVALALTEAEDHLVNHPGEEETEEAAPLLEAA